MLVTAPFPESTAENMCLAWELSSFFVPSLPSEMVTAACLEGTFSLMGRLVLVEVTCTLRNCREVVGPGVHHCKGSS